MLAGRLPPPPSPPDMDPVQLLAQEGESLRLDAAGLRVLAELGSTPVAVLAVAGMYRTGKSFLLNQLVDAPRFRVGNTTESCTRGIWLWVVGPEVWAPPAEFPDARLLVLDTEGLASIDQDETYDAKIFSLAILLSSFFIYNSMGVIDESAVDRLFLVGELTKSIALSSTDAEVCGCPQRRGSHCRYLPPVGRQLAPRMARARDVREMQLLAQVLWLACAGWRDDGGGAVAVLATLPVAAARFPPGHGEGRRGYHDLSVPCTLRVARRLT